MGRRWNSNVFTSQVGSKTVTDYKLPSHWECIEPTDDMRTDGFFDDGRDYDKPMFMRKDGLARIYFNEGEEGTPYQFAICWDEKGDGDCCGDFEQALRIADEGTRMKVEVTFPSDSGRQLAPWGKYRTVSRVIDKHKVDRGYTLQLWLPEVTWFDVPMIVEAQAICPEEFETGDEFEMFEGMRIVAKGRVL
jgi:hypothetical protein